MYKPGAGGRVGRKAACSAFVLRKEKETERSCVAYVIAET